MARLFLTISAAMLLASAGLSAWQRPDLVPGLAQSGTIEVRSAQELAHAVASARPGSHIILAPGDYRGLVINRPGDADGAPGIRISGPREARIKGLRFAAQASGWQVEGITILAPPTRANAVDVAGARAITLSGVLIRGTAAGDGPEEEQATGICLGGASAFTLAGSEISHVRLVMRLWDVRGVVLSGNRFVGAREGVFVNGAHGLAIHHNLFADWRPRYDLGEHPDMIQFANRRIADGSNDISIIGNLLLSGDARPVQGLFGGAQDFHKGLAPNGFMRNLVVRHNIYYGSSYHAISLGDLDGAVIERNTILASPHAFVGKRPPDPTWQDLSGTMPRLLLSNFANGRVVGNIAPRVNVRGFTGPEPEVRNNFAYEPRTPADGLNPGRNFAGPLVAGLSSLSDFAVRPGSAAARAGQGADVAQVGPAAASPDLAGLMREARRLAAQPLPPPGTLELPSPPPPRQPQLPAPTPPKPAA